MRNYTPAPKVSFLSIAVPMVLLAVALLPLRPVLARDFDVRYVPQANEVVHGYFVYWSTESQTFAEPWADIEDPGVPYTTYSFPLTGLPDYEDVYVVMTAYAYVDGVLLESDLSNEIRTVALDICVGVDCDGGNVDTRDDQCGGGVCSGTPSECSVDAGCSDGDVCNGAERCVGRRCQAASAPSADGTICTTGSGQGGECVAATATCEIPPLEPVTVGSFGVSPSGLQEVGTARTFTANASGGSGNLEYAWWVRLGDTWTPLNGFGPSRSLSYTPTQAGTYLIGVHVGSVGLDEVVYYSEQFTATEADPVNPITVHGFTSSPSTPKPAGATRTVSMSASGGTGSLEYAWWVRGTNGEWSQLAGFGSRPSIDWTPSLSGEYLVGVHVRSVGALDTVYYSESFSVR